MIDQTTLAYVNLYAVLGALADLTSLDPRAQAMLKGKKPTRLGIAVKGGPAATLVFEEQRCRLEEGEMCIRDSLDGRAHQRRRHAQHGNLYHRHISIIGRWI